MKRMFLLAAVLASVTALAVSRSAVPQKSLHATVPCDEFRAADSVPIEEKIKGKHEDIADMQLPSPTT
ncbi:MULTISPECIES: hypothetical protein [unclassified Rhizobium]|uniref:hypothetical protein n=1 Tax=unclassified Rhizobium TaxID=2613769 RepID=UPI00146D991A|nr:MULTISPECIES: hypothetical protein [unclassified Rhizobium]MBD9450359.1 hypothetical protein [Rhizobium sp. RHZ02]NMN71848.1 hypothetical protein [Rhizobium sp. 57MFTsu3.2]